MINKIKTFFAQHLNPADHEDYDLEKQLQMATAALLLEMAYADYELQDSEQQQLLQALQTGYDLQQQELDELIALSQEAHKNEASIHPFTSLINEHYNETQKREVIRLMWHVALADGKIDKHEMHLMRKMSDLLYVPRPVVMAIKNQEQEKLQT